MNLIIIIRFKFKCKDDSTCTYTADLSKTDRGERVYIVMWLNNGELEGVLYPEEEVKRLIEEKECIVTWKEGI